jgi:hypothetical protein
MHEINAFSNYFSIIGSGKFFGPFQEYRKNHMSTKWTFQAYLRGPFLATRIFLYFLNWIKKFYIIRKLFVSLRYIYLFILTTFYVCKNIITKFEIIEKIANSASKRAGRTSRWFVSAWLAWETWTRLHPSCVGPPVNNAARPDRGALTRTPFCSVGPFPRWESFFFFFFINFGYFGYIFSTSKYLSKIIIRIFYRTINICRIL